jgi:Flp pilus assembly pilin Flp
MLNRIKKLVMQKEGKGLVEYGLIIGLIGVAAVASLNLLTVDINGLLEKVNFNSPASAEDTTVTSG